MWLNTLKLLISQNKTLLIAAFISFILHALLLNNFSISFPSTIVRLPTLGMRLIDPLPNKNAIMPSIKTTKVEPTKTQTDQSDMSDEANAKASAMPQSVEESVSNQLAPHHVETDSNEAADIKDTNLAESAKLPIESIEEITSDTTLTNHTDTNTSTAYSYVETEFEITHGDDTGVLGLTRITFSMDRQLNSYQLTSISEAKGFASLFLGNLEQYSEGSVNKHGLKPNYYAYQYATKSEKNQYAHLLWTDGVIEMTSKKGKKSAPLPDGTQDFLSFMYQFMFTPPLNSMQLTMTNGKYLRTYTYSFEGEETIPTKLGDIKTLHLLKSGDSQEKMEIWLALDYQNIPVKIRKTEKNGSVIEQVVVMLKTVH